MRRLKQLLSCLRREPVFAATFVITLTLGIGAGFWPSRPLSRLIQSTSSSVPLAYVAGALTMALAPLLATAVPARRAQRADLLSLLRPK